MMNGEICRAIKPGGPEQLIRLPGQQYDEESGLYYNRTGITIRRKAYITVIRIGLKGG